MNEAWLGIGVLSSGIVVKELVLWEMNCSWQTIELVSMSLDEFVSRAKAGM